jgi:hypothetical protein
MIFVIGSIDFHSSARIGDACRRLFGSRTGRLHLRLAPVVRQTDWFENATVMPQPFSEEGLF